MLNLLSDSSKSGSCEDWLEEYLTTKRTDDNVLAVYDIGLAQDEKPVEYLAEKYRDEINSFTDGEPYSVDAEETMKHLIRNSENEDRLYFLSHKANF